MAAAKFKVSDIAKKMGKSEKDVIFQLQSLGAEVSDANQVLEPDVIQALVTGKKLTTRTRSVIMREDKPILAAKKEAVRPPRPIVKPPVRLKKEAPVEEAPVAPPSPAVIIPEFVTEKWWTTLLHGQNGLLLKWALLFRKGVVVTNIRYSLDRAGPEANPHPLTSGLHSE